MKIDIPDFALAAINILNKSGYEAYAVGGCVRDSLMGKLPNDWDICTNAHPEKVTAVFDGFKTIPTGLKHGTITIIIDNNPLEITTFRRDGEYSDSRRPDSVLFVPDLKEDLSRRDFTINAMAYSEKDGLIDFFGGRADLEKKLIRCVGEADIRFSEDALRILRAVRFSSVLGFEIEDKTSAALIEKKNRLSRVSPERIAAEMNKLLLGKNVFEVMKKYREMIAEFIPEIRAAFDFEQKNPHHNLNVYEHILKSIESAPKDLTIRLTMLFHDIGKPQCFTVDEKGIGHFKGHQKLSAETAERVLIRLKYPADTVSLVKSLILEHDNRLKADERIIKRFLRKYGYEFFKLQAQVRRADCNAQSPKLLNQKLEQIEAAERLCEKIVGENECFSLHELKINGDILIKNGFRQGEIIGDVLNRLLENVISGELENTETVLLNKARELL